MIPDEPDLAWRRAGATAVDYGLVGLGALGLAAVVAGTGLHRALPPLSPRTGQLLGLASLTVPATAALAAAEARGGSPGKRLLDLRFECADGSPVSFGRALGRTFAKVALPWELAHAGIWRVRTQDRTASGATAILAAYGTLGIAAAGVLRGRPWYDRLCRTRVVFAQRSDARPAGETGPGNG